MIVFGFLIFFHELGHFTVAKLSGVKVNEFALGMGPVLFQRKKGETAYSLRLFPIGGFVSMEGEDEDSSDENAFGKKTVFKRFCIVIAGATMNLILGYFIVLTLVIMSGTVGTTTIAVFDENSVSSNYLKANDEIISVNGSRVRTPNDITFEFMRDKDGEIELEVMREKEKIKLPPIQFKMDEVAEGIETIHLDFKVYSQKLSPMGVISYSFNWAVTIGKQVWVSLIDLVTGRFGFNQLSGPVGVATAIGEASTMGINSLLLMIAFITINLGIFNLLPLPALDGGRLVFIIIEAIIGKPVPSKYEGYVHATGMFLLFGLMIAVTFNDVLKLVKGLF
ncbi:MAG: site-2 protease family protein [Oscillospiraceae bacterium]